MSGLKYIMSGEGYDERIRILYNGNIVCDSYIDDLVTSASGELELKMNFGEHSKSYSMIARLIGTDVVFVSKCLDGYDTDYQSILVIVTKDEFYQLWTDVRYDPTSDYQNLKKVSRSEIWTSWLLLSKSKFDLESVENVNRRFESMILSTSSDDKLINTFVLKHLISKYAEYEFSKTIVKASNDFEKIIFYLDQKDNYEWDALRIDNQKNVFLHLGFENCININFKISD